MQVDATDEKNKELAKRFQIRGYPTIKIFRFSRPQLFFFAFLPFPLSGSSFVGWRRNSSVSGAVSAGREKASRTTKALATPTG